MSCLEMKCLSSIWKRILVLFTVFSMMIVSLPAYAERLPDFLAKIQPSEIFPGADRYGKPEGKPLVARVYKGEEQLGLVYITTDVVNTRGYSSKPIDTMVAFGDEEIDIFVAKNLKKGEQDLDEDESIDIEEWELDDLLELIYKGEIKVSKTVAAILAYKNKYQV